MTWIYHHTPFLVVNEYLYNEYALDFRMIMLDLTSVIYFKNREVGFLKWIVQLPLIGIVVKSIYMLYISWLG